jgi:hypothetical protein
MALDFSKFILKPDFSWADKISESAAAATKLAQKTSQDQGFYKYLNQQTEGGKFLNVDEISNETLNKSINDRLSSIRGRASMDYSNNMPVGTVQYNLGNDLNQLRTDLNKVKNFQTAWKAFESENKDKPYIDMPSAKMDFVKTFFKDEKGDDKDLVGILNSKDGDPVTHLNDMLNNSSNIYTPGSFNELIKKSRGSQTSEQHEVRDKSGNVTGDKLEVKVPSNLFEVRNLEEDNTKPKDLAIVVKGGVYNVSDPKVADVYHSLLGDNETDQDFDVMDDDAFNSIMTDGGVKAYVDQQARNFEKQMEANGIAVRGADGNYTQEYIGELNNFKQAAAYKALTDAYNISGGGGIKSSTVKRARLPRRAASGSGAGAKVNPNDRKDFMKTMDEEPEDDKGFRSIKSLFAGFNDAKGKEYGRKTDLKIGYSSDDKDWYVNVYTKDLKDNLSIKETMTLSKFLSSSLSQDPGGKDTNLRDFLREWAKNNTPKKGKAD